MSKGDDTPIWEWCHHATGSWIMVIGPSETIVLLVYKPPKIADPTYQPHSWHILATRLVLQYLHGPSSTNPQTKQGAAVAKSLPGLLFGEQRHVGTAKSFLSRTLFQGNPLKEARPPLLRCRVSVILDEQKHHPQKETRPRLAMSKNREMGKT